MRFLSLTSFLLVLITRSLAEGGSLLGLSPTQPEILQSIELLLEAESLINSLTKSDPTFDVSSLNPVKVTLPGGGVLDLTALYGPIQQIWPRLGIIGNLACTFCSNDCTFVHNKFGASFGTTVDNANAVICLCNERAPNDGANFTDVVGKCGGITGNDDTDKTIDLSIKKLLRDASKLLTKCIPQNDNEVPQSESPLCQLDCNLAHGMAFGRCISGVTPVATYPGQSHPGFYCGCFN